MSKRKTFEVEHFRNRINKYLTLDTLSQAEKSALAFILETILHDANDYNGFRYLFDWNAIEPVERERIKYNREYL